MIKLTNARTNFSPVFISFFILSLLSCKQPTSDFSVDIAWKNNKAVAFKIPQASLKNSEKNISVRLTTSDTDIIGEAISTSDSIFFQPLVPFTPGLKYNILIDRKVMTTILIPLSATTLPEILAVYPSVDTVPENLLKIYIHFSQPMQEGNSLSHIVMMKGADTLKGTFLDVQPELWNNDGTVLTLWLDPGRIKRDLTPNQTLGAPLIGNNQYEFIIKDGWKAKDGNAIENSVMKRFVTKGRDAQSPNPNQWTYGFPQMETSDPVVIDFREPLDFSLASETITILSTDGTAVAGTVQLRDDDRRFLFIPVKPWAKGNYTIRIESRLEDLAGNNLNRLFDRDVTKTVESFGFGYYDRSFVLK